jgi:phosphoribosylanthranilate isomerase
VTRIKVSGLVRPEDADAVSRAGVDYAACMFHARSPRYVTIEQAIAIRRALSSTVAFVGVFVDTPAPLVQRVADHCRLDHIQLFGTETRGTVDAMRTHAFKAVTVISREEAELAARTYLGHRGGLASEPALMLYFPESVADPASLVPVSARRSAVVLAANALDADNVAATVRAVRPWGIDVWDAVESQPGQIDRVRLAAFVTAIRSVASDAPGGE